jgi:hypothetical protein
VKRHFLRGSIVAIAICIALVTAETVVRTFIPQDLGLLAPWYESHPRYRFRHYPDIDAMRRWGTPYRLRTNSHAIRSDREEPYLSPDETRVVVHGDSLTFGVGVENEDTFVRRLERALQPTFETIDVLNLGVAGHGPDQEYLLFLEEGRKYSPRICIIAVCLGNDLDQLGWSNAAFRLDGNDLDFVPYSTPILKKLSESPPYRWLASRSHLMLLARYTLIDAPTYARELAAQQTRVPPVPLARAVYRDFVAAVRREDAIPVLLLLPTKDQIAHRRDALPLGHSENSADLLRDTLLEFCEANTNTVTCVDALDHLALADVAFEDLFIPGDDHFSSSGHRVVANALHEPIDRLLNQISPRGSGGRSRPAR